MASSRSCWLSVLGALRACLWGAQPPVGGGGGEVTSETALKKLTLWKRGNVSCLSAPGQIRVDVSACV